MESYLVVAGMRVDLTPGEVLALLDALNEVYPGRDEACFQSAYDKLYPIHKQLVR